MTTGPHDTAPRDAARAPTGEPLVRIQDAVGVVARRAKDLRLHEALGNRVGYRLEGTHYGTLARLALLRQCTITELAEVLGLELSTVSRRVKALEAQGLVERWRSPADLRSSLIRLTPAGDELFRSLSGQWREMLSEVLVGWAPADVERFADLFDLFARALERYASEPEARRAAAVRTSDRPPG